MSPGNYKTLKISIGAKKMCKDAVKKLPIVIRHVSNQYNFQ